MQKDKIQLFFIFVAIVVLLFGFLGSLTGYQIVSLALFFFILLKFVFDLGSQISVKNIIVLIVVLQCLVGPVLGYIYDNEIDESYQMKVDQSVYFGYVLPAILAFTAGLFIKLRKTRYKPAFLNTTFYYKKGRFLILFG